MVPHLIKKVNNGRIIMRDDDQPDPIGGNSARGVGLGWVRVFKKNCSRGEE